MKLGILKCDEVREELRPVHGNYPDMFIRLLRPLAPQLEFATYDMQQQEAPHDPRECDAYLITGSKSSVYEQEPWILALKDQVTRLHDAGSPMIGICFGHQMIAHALGGATEKAEQGWGVGVQTYEVAAEAEWLSPTLDSFSILASHQDQVTRLPAGAALVARSAFCPNAMFRIGDQVLTFQGHPEFSKDYSLALMQIREEQLGPEVFSQGVASLEQPIQAWEAGKWILNFLQR
jgi:GMP synthase-like glutamine amidotransferase